MSRNDYDGALCAGFIEKLEPRLLLSVDPVSGMSITADTVFSAGTFILTAGITIDADDVTVTGAGQGDTIIKVIAGDTTGMNVFTIDGRENVVIEDLTIDGQRTSQSYPWSWGAVPHWDGINVIDSAHVTIQDVTVEHMGNNGIQITASVWNVYYEDNHILDVTVTDNGWLNTEHKGGGVWMTNTNNTTIQRTTASLNGYHGLGGVGDNFQILDSISSNNAQGGFVIKGANSIVDNNVADGNDIGIYSNGVTDDAANVISNNIVTNSITGGISTYNEVTDPIYATVVVNNTVSGLGSKGLYSAADARPSNPPRLFRRPAGEGIPAAACFPCYQLFNLERQKV